MLVKCCLGGWQPGEVVMLALEMHLCAQVRQPGLMQSAVSGSSGSRCFIYAGRASLHLCNCNHRCRLSPSLFINDARLKATTLPPSDPTTIRAEITKRIRLMAARLGTRGKVGVRGSDRSVNKWREEAGGGGTAGEKDEKRWRAAADRVTGMSEGFDCPETNVRKGRKWEDSFFFSFVSGNRPNSNCLVATVFFLLYLVFVVSGTDR